MGRATTPIKINDTFLACEATMLPGVIYQASDFMEFAEATAMICENGWIYMWPLQINPEGELVCTDEDGALPGYYAIRVPSNQKPKSIGALSDSFTELYWNAFGDDCDPIDDNVFGYLKGATPEQFIEGRGERAREI